VRSNKVMGDVHSMTEIARIAALAVILSRSIIRGRTSATSASHADQQSCKTCLDCLPATPLSVSTPAELMPAGEGDRP